MAEGSVAVAVAIATGGGAATGAVSKHAVGWLFVQQIPGASARICRKNTAAPRGVSMRVLGRRCKPSQVPSESTGWRHANQGAAG